MPLTSVRVAPFVQVGGVDELGEADVEDVAEFTNDGLVIDVAPGAELLATEELVADVTPSPGLLVEELVLELTRAPATYPALPLVNVDPGVLK